MSESDSSWKETDRLFNQPTRVATTLLPKARFGFLLNLQFLTFFFMEVGFIALAWFCFTRGVLVPYVDYSYLSTAKSGFVALFNVWHTAAIACGLHTCFESFSREWAARPERTDMVSTVTSGLLDRLIYFLSPRATRTFKAALLVCLALMLLRTTGSSAITVTGATLVGSIGVNNLIATPVGGQTSYMDSVFVNRLNQANLITRLERLHGVGTGFEPQPDWLIPLPNLQTDSEDDTLKITYRTDLVHFNYSCHWQTPDEIILNFGTVIGNETWTDWFVVNSTLSGVVNTSTIVQLTPDNKSTGVSVFLFVGGGNMTADVNAPSPQTDAGSDAGSSFDAMNQYQLNDGDQWEIDLSNQPTVDVWEMTGDTTYPPLATLLVCDPQLHFTSGVVQLNPVPDLNTPDLRVKSWSSNAQVGNIDPSTARDLFSWALAKTSGPLSDGLNTDTDSMGLALFLSPALKNENNTLQFIPRDPRDIEKKLGLYMLSALKAFTNGFTGNSSAPASEGTSSQNYTPVAALFDNEGLELSTSMLFAITHLALFVLTACGLVGLGYVNSTQRRAPFELESVEVELGKKNYFAETESGRDNP